MKRGVAGETFLTEGWGRGVVGGGGRWGRGVEFWGRGRGVVRHKGGLGGGDTKAGA